MDASFPCTASCDRRGQNSRSARRQHEHTRSTCRGKMQRRTQHCAGHNNRVMGGVRQGAGAHELTPQLRLLLLHLRGEKKKRPRSHPHSVRENIIRGSQALRSSTAGHAQWIEDVVFPPRLVDDVLRRLPHEARRREPGDNPCGKRKQKVQLVSVVGIADQRRADVDGGFVKRKPSPSRTRELGLDLPGLLPQARHLLRRVCGKEKETIPHRSAFAITTSTHDN